MNSLLLEAFDRETLFVLNALVMELIRQWLTEDGDPYSFRVMVFLLTLLFFYFWQMICSFLLRLLVIKSKL